MVSNLLLIDESNRMADEVAKAMAKVAGTANVAKIPLEKVSSWIALISSKTREGAETIGFSLQSILSRYMQIKEKGFNEEDATNINDVTKALASMGIKATDSQGQLIGFADVLDKLGERFKDLDNNSKAYILTTLAGTRQSSRLANLLNDYSKSVDLYNQSLNSAGTTQQKFNIYQQSLQASLDKLGNTKQDVLRNIFNSNDLKAFITFGDDALKVINGLITSFGTFPTIITGALIALGKFKSEWKAISLSFDDDGKVKREGFLVKGFRGLTDSIKGIRTQWKEMNDVTRNSITNLNGQVPLLTNLSNGFKALTGSTIAQTLATGALTIASTALNAVIGLGLGLVISGTIGMLSKFINSKRTAREEAEKFNETMKAELESIEKLKSQLSTLEELNKKTSLSADEKERLKNTNNEIADKYPELVSYYDAETKTFQVSIEKIKEVIAQKQKLAMIENSNNLETAKKTLKDAEDKKKQAEEQLRTNTKTVTTNYKDSGKFETKVALSKSEREDLINDIRESEDLIDTHNKTVNQATMFINDFIATQTKAKTSTQEINKQLLGYGYTQKDINEAIKMNTKSLNDNGKALDENKPKVTDYNKSLSTLEKTMTESLDRIKLYRDTIKNINENGLTDEVVSSILGDPVKYGEKSKVIEAVVSGNKAKLLEIIKASNKNAEKEYKDNVAKYQETLNKSLESDEKYFADKKKLLKGKNGDLTKLFADAVGINVDNLNSKYKNDLDNFKSYVDAKVGMLKDLQELMKLSNNMYLNVNSSGKAEVNKSSLGTIVNPLAQKFAQQQSETLANQYNAKADKLLKGLDQYYKPKSTKSTNVVIPTSSEKGKGSSSSTSGSQTVGIEKFNMYEKANAKLSEDNARIKDIEAKLENANTAQAITLLNQENTLLNTKKQHIKELQDLQQKELSNLTKRLSKYVGKDGTINIDALNKDISSAKSSKSTADDKQMSFIVASVNRYKTLRTEINATKDDTAEVNKKIGDNLDKIGKVLVEKSQAFPKRYKDFIEKAKDELSSVSEFDSEGKNKVFNNLINYYQNYIKSLETTNNDLIKQSKTLTGKAREEVLAEVENNKKIITEASKDLIKTSGDLSGYNYGIRIKSESKSLGAYEDLDKEYQHQLRMTDIASEQENIYKKIIDNKKSEREELVKTIQDYENNLIPSLEDQPELLEEANNQLRDYKNQVDSIDESIKDTNKSITDLIENQKSKALDLANQVAEAQKKNDKITIDNAEKELNTTKEKATLDIKTIDNQLASMDMINELKSEAEERAKRQLEIEKLQVQSEAEKTEQINKQAEIEKQKLEVQKAQLALDKVKNEKNTRVFHEGQGFVWEANPEAVRKAQEDLDKANVDLKSKQDDLSSWIVESTNKRNEELKQKQQEYNEWELKNKEKHKRESLEEDKKKIQEELELHEKSFASMKENFEKTWESVDEIAKKLLETYNNNLDIAITNLQAKLATLNSMNSQGIIGQVMNAPVTPSLPNIPAHANGTLSAEGGLSVVGEHENGFELRVLNKGDGIIPHNVTKNLWEIGKNFNPISLLNLTRIPEMVRQVNNNNTNNGLTIQNMQVIANNPTQFMEQMNQKRLQARLA